MRDKWAIILTKRHLSVAKIVYEDVRQVVTPMLLNGTKGLVRTVSRKHGLSAGSAMLRSSDG